MKISDFSLLCNFETHEKEPTRLILFNLFEFEIIEHKYTTL